MANCKPCFTPIFTSMKLSLSDGSPFANQTLYRSIIVALQYLYHTCLDISFVVNKLSQFLSNPLDKYWVASKRVLCYLRGTPNHGLHIKPSKSPLSLHWFSDADWASSIDDRKSTRRGCVFFGGNLAFWTSKNQPTISKSSTKAEYRALS